VGPKTGLEAVAKRKIPRPCQELNPDQDKVKMCIRKTVVKGKGKRPFYLYEENGC